jgi:tRNA pseudouridine13 synthase
LIDDTLLAQILAPPRETEDLADLGGVIRARPEDFMVEEIPAYESDGRPGHLLLELRKRLMTTEEAIRELAHQLKVPRAEIGLAGLKDRDAVTRQRVSVPDRARPALARFAHPAIELGPAEPHSHKLRRGHLRGNRFVLILRELPVGLELAEQQARAKLERLTTRGLRNYYGGQRFGKDGRNVSPGLAALAGKGPRRGKADLVVSAGQSALFNLYLAERARRGLLDHVLVGDILQKRETGGMFESGDAAADQARLDAGELVVTGPMFGSKTRSPSPETPAEALEHEILALARLTPAKLARLGRKVPGARRQLRIWPEQVRLALAPECPELDLSPGLELGFILPPGSYATVLIRELCG